MAADMKMYQVILSLDQLRYNCETLCRSLQTDMDAVSLDLARDFAREAHRLAELASNLRDDLGRQPIRQENLLDKYYHADIMQ